MAEATKEEVIGTGALEGLDSPFTLMLTRKSWASYFRLGFSIGLGKEWSNLGLKGLPSKLHKPLVFPCPLMSHCNSRFLKMTNSRRLSTRQSPNIVAGPICPYLLPCILTRLSKLHLSTHHISPLMLAKS